MRRQAERSRIGRRRPRGSLVRAALTLVAVAAVLATLAIQPLAASAHPVKATDRQPLHALQPAEVEAHAVVGGHGKAGSAAA